MADVANDENIVSGEADADPMAMRGEASSSDIGQDGQDESSRDDDGGEPASSLSPASSASFPSSMRPAAASAMVIRGALPHG